MSRRSVEITTDLMLRAYRHGLFPMAETRRGERLYWLDPERRGILPLDRFHLPRRLARTVLSDAFTVTVDQDFAGTIAGCASAAPGREDTWINPQAPTHVLLIPKGPYVSFADFSANGSGEEIAGFMRAVGKVAKDLGLEAQGYRLLANMGEHSGQEVPHFHVHLFAGRPLGRMLSS